MLLTELTVDGTLHRISNRALPLEHFYDPRIASFSQVKVAVRKPYGGYAGPVFGRVDLLPPVFDDAWPPPASCDMTAKITASTEAAAVVMFDGVAHRERIKRDGIEYQLYPYGSNHTATDAVYSDTLVNVFSAACTTMGLTLDSSAARSPSPSMDYTATGKHMLIDNLSDMAAWVCHCFYIEDGTLYLIDMLANNGSRTWTEFDIFPSVYNDPAAVSLVKCRSVGVESSVTSSFDYGRSLTISPVCQTDAADIDTALADIIDVVNMPTVQFIKPLSEPPKIGERISLRDESMPQPIDVWARVRAITWDFDREQCVIEGEGVIA